MTNRSSRPDRGGERQELVLDLDRVDRYDRILGLESPNLERMVQLIDSTIGIDGAVVDDGEVEHLQPAAESHLDELDALG